MSVFGDSAGLADQTSSNSYPNIAESYQADGQRILSEAGCEIQDVKQQISCLRGLPDSSLVNLAAAIYQVVQDGKYVNPSDLDLIRNGRSTAHVPVIQGIAAEAGASLIRYPSEDIQSELDGIQEALGLSITQAIRIFDSGLFPSPNTGNITFDSYSIAQRVATDKHIRCPNQALVYAGAFSGGLKSSYYYEIQQTISGSIIPYVFGNLGTSGTSLDLDNAQLISSYFAEFIRSGQPNPNPQYLAARGHEITLDVVNAFDPWEPVLDSKGPIHILDFPPQKGSFQDLEQCEFLGLPIDYLLS